MEEIIFTRDQLRTRREFMKKTMVSAGVLTFSGTVLPGCSRQISPPGMYGVGRELSIGETRRINRKDKSIVSFLPGKDVRQATYDALKPLKETVERDIQGKLVVIKPNMQNHPEHLHEMTDINQIRGILDFLKLVYDRQVIISSGTATLCISMDSIYAEVGYLSLEQEYNCKLIDHNDMPTTTAWILAGYQRPQPINLISLYLNPNVYVISACRLKTSGGVLVTLSIKNIAMGSPKSHYRFNTSKGTDRPPAGLNEKSKMHGGIGSKKGRELSYNIFTVAQLGAHADLAVLDGVVGADGNGPWNADPIKHGVVIASNDPVAADRLGSALMGVDYNNLVYIQWCAQAGIGRDNFDDWTYIGPDWRPHVKKYRLNKSAEQQVEWIHELRENLEKES